jgi:hypothetical protein
MIYSKPDRRVFESCQAQRLAVAIQQPVQLKAMDTCARGKKALLVLTLVGLTMASGRRPTPGKLGCNSPLCCRV